MLGQDDGLLVEQCYLNTTISSTTTHRRLTAYTEVVPSHESGDDATSAIRLWTDALDV